MEEATNLLHSVMLGKKLEIGNWIIKPHYFGGFVCVTQGFVTVTNDSNAVLNLIQKQLEKEDAS